MVVELTLLCDTAMKTGLDEDFNGWLLSLPSDYRGMATVDMPGWTLSKKNSNRNRFVAC